MKITRTKLNKLACNVFKRNEGIAIIVSIGFLAIVSVLALTFLFISSVDRKSARNYNDLTSARILAKSVVNRALIAMKTYTGDLNNLTSFYDGDAGSSSMVADESLNSLLITNVNGINFYTDTTYNDAVITPTWQYIKIDDGQNENKRIIGRIAYAVCDVPSNDGWVMISAAVDDGRYAPDQNGGVTEYGSPASPQSTITAPPYTGIDKNGNYILGRKGVNVSEISLNSLDFITETQLKKMSSEKANPGGAMPETGWGSADAFFSALQIKNEDLKAEFLEYFSFGNPKDKEAFWIDSNDDEVKNDNELYHRFDLTRSNWDSITVDSILSSRTLYTDAYNEDSVTSISWLTNWNDAGEMGSTDTCKKQIAANLIDYNDTDDIATTDDEDNPTYVGLEEGPYSNEVQLEIHGSISVINDIDTTIYVTPYSQVIQDQINAGTLIVNYDESINYEGASINEYEFIFNAPTLTLELINIYSGTGVIPTNANVALSIDYLYGGEVNPQEYKLLNEEEDFSFAPSTYYEISDEEYEFRIKSFDSSFTKTITVIDEAYTGNPIIEAFVNHIKVKVTNSDNGDFYDYSYVVDSDQPDTRVIVNGITSNTYVLNYQVQDPRQNLFDTDWEEQDPGDRTISDITDDNSDRDDLSINKNYPTNADRDTYSDTMDYEDYSAQPWDLSTAYIRNAPMESPWELGAIHRGSKWQTLNLKKYKVASTYIGDGGGGSYSDGDANILDQIKMNSEITTLGKINLNVYQASILKLLFYAIYTHSGYDVPGTQDSVSPYLGFQVTETAAETLDTTVRNYTLNTKQFDTRSEVVNSTTMFSDNTLDAPTLQQTDDATQEEIIGKFINLTKADQIRTAQLYIIAVAQIIQDVGGVTINKDLNNDGDIDTADESAIGIDINGDGDINDSINETISNTQIGIYDQYADQITSTQKLLIIIYKTTTDQYRIRRLEYVID